MNKLKGSDLIKISDKRWISVDSITSKRFYRGKGRPRNTDYTIDLAPETRAFLKKKIKSVSHKRVYKKSNSLMAPAVFFVVVLALATFGFVHNYLTSGAFSVTVTGSKAHAEVEIPKSEHELYLEKKEKDINEAVSKYSKYFEDDTTDEKNARMIANKFYDTGKYELALCVVANESGFRSNAGNVNDNGSQDKGLWQINDIHGLSDEYRYDPVKSTEWAYNRFIQKHSFSSPTKWYGVNKCSDLL